MPPKTRAARAAEQAAEKATRRQAHLKKLDLLFAKLDQLRQNWDEVPFHMLAELGIEHKHLDLTPRNGNVLFRPDDVFFQPLSLPTVRKQYADHHERVGEEEDVQGFREYDPPRDAEERAHGLWDPETCGIVAHSYLVKRAKHTFLSDRALSTNDELRHLRQLAPI
jgi:hypothetical protein